MQASTYVRRAPLTLPANERFPHPHGLCVSLLRSGIQLTMRGMLRTFNRLEIEGRENLPLDRSFIMVCNHSSHLDAVCLLASLPLTRVHRAFPVAAADYFFATPIRSMLSVIAVNGLPIDRHHGCDGLEMCRAILNVPGHVLIIFPEGTRTCSGAIGRFRSGVARLAAGTRTPIVPCHISGAFEAWPKGSALPRAFPVHLRIGRPRTFADFSAADHVAISQISSQLRDDVVELGEGSIREP
jgi:1-acyl-sn-glycerol-3-phosphate acyltransferase